MPIAVRDVVRNSYARRLVVAVLTLAIVDRFVPGLLARAERARYESSTPYRFGNADMFSVGPFVSYLRDHPRGDRPRLAFLGPSTVWGYSLDTIDSVPAQFQRLVPDYRVFNLGMTRMQTGSAYLIAKAIIDSVEMIWLFDARTPSAEPMMPQWIPVDDDDVRRFGLEPRNRVDRWLQQALSPWQLYRDAYRLQSAWLGTSTRVWLYTHKATLVGDAAALWRGSPTSSSAMPASEAARSTSTVAVRVPQPRVAPDARRREELRTSASTSVLWSFGALVHDRGKRAVFVELERGDVADDALADLNAVFGPDVTFVRLIAPPDLMTDPLHFTAAGAAEVAKSLYNYSAAVIPRP